MTKKLGHIKAVKFGLCGYQDAMLGFSFDLGGKIWSTTHTIPLCWSKDAGQARTTDVTLSGIAIIAKLMQKAKVTDINKLVGIPVEVSFESDLGPNIGFEIIEDMIL